MSKALFRNVLVKMKSIWIQLYLPNRRDQTELELFLILTFVGSTNQNSWASPLAATTHSYYSRARIYRVYTYTVYGIYMEFTPFMCNKIFLKKLLQKFVALIFTLQLFQYFFHPSVLSYFPMCQKQGRRSGVQSLKAHHSTSCLFFQDTSKIRAIRSVNSQGQRPRK